MCLFGMAISAQSRICSVIQRLRRSCIPTLRPIFLKMGIKSFMRCPCHRYRDGITGLTGPRRSATPQKSSSESRYRPVSMPKTLLFFRSTLPKTFLVSGVDLPKTFLI